MEFETKLLEDRLVKHVKDTRIPLDKKICLDLYLDYFPDKPITDNWLNEAVTNFKDKQPGITEEVYNLEGIDAEIFLISYKHILKKPESFGLVKKAKSKQDLKKIIFIDTFHCNGNINYNQSINEIFYLVLDTINQKTRNNVQKKIPKLIKIDKTPSPQPVKKQDKSTNNHPTTYPHSNRSNRETGRTEDYNLVYNPHIEKDDKAILEISERFHQNVWDSEHRINKLEKLYRNLQKIKTDYKSDNSIKKISDLEEKIQKTIQSFRDTDLTIKTLKNYERELYTLFLPQITQEKVNKLNEINSYCINRRGTLNKYKENPLLGNLVPKTIVQNEKLITKYYSKSIDIVGRLINEGLSNHKNYTSSLRKVFFSEDTIKNRLIELNESLKLWDQCNYIDINLKDLISSNKSIINEISQNQLKKKISEEIYQNQLKTNDYKRIARSISQYRPIAESDINSIREVKDHIKRVKISNYDDFNGDLSLGIGKLISSTQEIENTLDSNISMRRRVIEDMLDHYKKKLDPNKLSNVILSGFSNQHWDNKKKGINSIIQEYQKELNSINKI